MKLYTEKQVRRLIEHYYDVNWTIYDEFDELTPIELPSDEEIKEYVKSTGYYGHCTQEYHEGIEEGAKYVINKIQGGNK